MRICNWFTDLLHWIFGADSCPVSRDHNDHHRWGIPDANGVFTLKCGAQGVIV